MTVPFRMPLEHPLTEAAQQLMEAEQRRDRQIRSVASYVEGTEARTYAQHVLRVMERNLSISRVQQALIQNLLQDDRADDAA